MDEDMRYTGEENLNTTGTDPDGLSSDGYPQNGGQPGDDGMEVQDTYIPDEGYTPDPEFTQDQEDTSAPETAPAAIRSEHASTAVGSTVFSSKILCMHSRPPS